AFLIECGNQESTGILGAQLETEVPVGKQVLAKVQTSIQFFEVLELPVPVGLEGKSHTVVVEFQSGQSFVRMELKQSRLLLLGQSLDAAVFPGQGMIVAKRD